MIRKNRDRIIDNSLFKMPNSIFDVKLTATELTVLSAIYSLKCHALNRKRKYIKVGQKTIATICGLTPQTVARAMAKLWEYGYVLEIRRYFVDEHRLGRYVYTLPIINKKEGFFFVNRKVFKKNLKPAQMRMYLYCCKCADSKTKQFWNSYNDISHALNIKRSSVITTISELIKLGLINRYKVIKKDGSYSDNYYQINTIIINKPKIHKKRRCQVYFAPLSILHTQEFFKSMINHIGLFVKHFLCYFFKNRGSPKISISVHSTHFDTIRERKINKLYLKYRCNLLYYN